jgi:hypothetical protein
MSSDLLDFRIGQVRRRTPEDGSRPYYVGSVNGHIVHRSNGSWQWSGSDGTLRDLHPQVAAELQIGVRQLERKERRNAVCAENDT